MTENPDDLPETASGAGAATAFQDAENENKPAPQRGLVSQELSADASPHDDAGRSDPTNGSRSRRILGAGV